MLHFFVTVCIHQSSRRCHCNLTSPNVTHHIHNNNIHCSSSDPRKSLYLHYLKEIVVNLYDMDSSASVEFVFTLCVRDSTTEDFIQ